jgi:hypothetical protein
MRTKTADIQVYRFRRFVVFIVGFFFFVVDYRRCQHRRKISFFVAVSLRYGPLYIKGDDFVQAFSFQLA